MRKMTNAILNFILICTLLSSCQTREAKEALALGRKRVEPYFIKCGESWYAREKFASDPDIKKFLIPGVNAPLGKEYGVKDFGRFIEARGLEYNIRSTGPLTEADRLNGFEWKGHFSVSIGVHRYYQGGRWGAWGDPVGAYVSFNITRFKGEWYLHGGPFELRSEPIPPQLQPITCSNIPK